MTNEALLGLTMFFAVGCGLYLLGRSLIEDYFRRKEKFVDHLNNKLKGKPNGSIE